MRRMAKFDVYQEYTRLLGTEIQFERELAQAAAQDGIPMQRVYTDDSQAWRE